MKKDSFLSLAAAVAFALTAGVISERAAESRATRVPAAPTSAVDESLRDAVSAPAAPETVGLAGKPVPTSWFKTPEENRAEIDSSLLASRRRRTSELGRRVALQ